MIQAVITATASVVVAVIALWPKVVDQRGLTEAKKDAELLKLLSDLPESDMQPLADAKIMLAAMVAAEVEAEFERLTNTEQLLRRDLTPWTILVALCPVVILAWRQGQPPFEFSWVGIAFWLTLSMGAAMAGLMVWLEREASQNRRLVRRLLRRG